MRERSMVYGSVPQNCSVTYNGRFGTCALPYGKLVTATTYQGVCPGETVSVHMVDVVTKGFDKRVARGEIINSPMTKTTSKSVSVVTPFSTTLSQRLWKTACNPDAWIYNQESSVGTFDSATLLSLWGFSHIDVPDIDIERLKNQAITNAWAKVEDCDVGVLEAMAEFRLTIVSLVDLIKRIRRIIGFLGVRHWFMIAQELSAKNIADRYMEVRYLLRPLIYDIRAFYNKLSTPNLKLDTRQTFRGWKTDRETVQDVVETVRTHTNTYRTSTQRFTSVRSAVREVSVRTGVLAHVESSTLLDRWGFDNIFEAMWETTKFSYVVDWVFNVGKTIAALTPEVGLKPLASWCVVEDTSYQFCSLVDATEQITPLNNWLVSESTFEVGECKMSQTLTVKERIPNPSLPILPSFELKLDIWKLTDLLIMLSQLLRK